jgi:hypothetical protein
MADLRSEDQECVSLLRLTPGAIEPVGEQQWQKIAITFISGERRVELLDNESCLLCRQPSDEIEQLANQLKQLISGTKTTVLFEPAEPSFELNFSSQPAGGIKVEAWLDASNGTTGFYAGDGLGIRFLTDLPNLQKFVDELNAETSQT